MTDTVRPDQSLPPVADALMLLHPGSPGRIRR